MSVTRTQPKCPPGHHSWRTTPRGTKGWLDVECVICGDRCIGIPAADRARWTPPAEEREYIPSRFVHDPFMYQIRPKREKKGECGGDC